MTRETDGDIKRSMMAVGSEPVYEFYCQICSEIGQHQEAVGFCVDCGDYLCKTCAQHHNRTRLTINHEVLDEHSMPKDNPLPHDKYSRVIETKCSIHQRRLAEYYCKEHNSIGCVACFTESHRSCANVVYIPEIPDNFEQSQEYKTFEQCLKDISKKASDIIQHSHDNVTFAEKCYEHALQAIRNTREEIEKLLDEAENKLIKQAESIKADDIKKMKSWSDGAKKIAGEVENISSKITKLQDSKKLCQLYIAVKDVSSEIKSMKSRLHEDENSNCVKHYAFYPSIHLRDMCKNADTFGKVCLRQSDRVSQSKTTKKPKAMKATHVSDIDLKSDKKSSGYSLTGSAVLSSSKMIVVNYEGKTVSLLDIRSNKLIYDLNVSSQPWDVCKISENQAIVSVSAESKLLLLNVTDVLYVEKEISVNGECRGVAYNRGKLLVTFVSPPKLEIIDLQGNVTKQIENDRDGRKLFEWPQYVCNHSDEDVFYISDVHANKVICLRYNGDIQSAYAHSELTGPEKLCTDQLGNVYVASFDKKSVHMITADCTMIKILLTQADGLTSKVCSVSLCHETNRMFVGMCEDSRLKVFQLH